MGKQVFLGSVYATMELQLDGLQRSVSQAQRQLNGLGSQVEKTGARSFGQFASSAANSLDSVADKIGSVIKTVGILAVTSSVGFGAMAKAAFDQVRSVETARAIMTGYGASVKDVNKALAEAIKFVRSPLGKLFQREDIIRTTSQLYGMGIQLKNTTKGSIVLAKATSAGNGTFDEFLQVLRTVKAAGKLTADQYQVLASRGVNLDASMVGTKMSAQDLLDAMNKVLPDKLIAGRAKTIDGKLITLKSSFRDLGNQLLGVDAETSKFVKGGAGDKLLKLIDGLIVALGTPEMKQAFEKLGNQIADMAETAIPLLLKGIQFLAENFGKIILTLKVLIGLFVALKLAALGLRIAGGIDQAIGLYKKLTGVKKTAAGIKNLTQTTTGLTKAGASMTRAQSAIKTLNSGIISIILLAGAIAAMSYALKIANDAIPDDIGTLVNKLLVLGEVIVAFTALAYIIGKLKISISGMLALVGVAVVLVTVSLAMKKANDAIPSDIAGFSIKLGNLGIAITAIGLLAVIVSKLSGQIVPGLLVILAIAGTLVLVGKAVESANKSLPSNVGDFSKKIANLSIAVGAISLLAGVLGLIAGTGVGALVIVAGLVALLAIAGAMIVIAEAIAEINAKVPSSTGAIKKKIDTINKAVEYMVVGNLGNLLKNLVGSFNVSAIAVIARGYVKIASYLSLIAVIPLDENAIKEKVTLLKKIISSITADNGDSLGSQIMTMAKNFVSMFDTAAIGKVVETYRNIALDLNKIQSVKLDKDKIVEKIKLIKATVNFLSASDATSVAGTISRLVKNFLGAIDIGSIGKVVSTYYDIGQKLNSIQSLKLNKKAVQASIVKLQDVISLVSYSGDGSWWSSLTNAVNEFLNAKAVEAAGKVIEVYAGIIGAMKKLEKMKLDTGVIKEKVRGLTEVVRYVMDTKGGDGLLGAIGGFFTGGGINEGDITKVLSIVKKMSSIARALNAMVGMNVEMNKAKVIGIRDVIYEIGQIKEVSNIDNKEKIVVKSQSILNKMSGMARTINAIPMLPITSSLKIQALVTAIHEIGKIKEVSGIDNKEKIVAASSRILVSLSKFGRTLAKLPDIGGKASIINTLIAAVNNLASNIKSSSSKLFSAGQSLSTQLAKGVRSGVGAVRTAGVELQHQLHSAIQSKMRDEYNQGKALGTQLVNGIKSKISGAQSAGRRLQGGMWDAIQSKMGDEYKQGAALAGKFVSGLKSKAGSAYNAGTYAIQGFINGVNSKSGTLYGIGRQIGASFADSVHKGGKGGSPWKTTIQEGVWAMQGLQIGIESNMKTLRSTAMSSAETVMSGFKDGVTSQLSAVTKTMTQASEKISDAFRPELTMNTMALPRSGYGSLMANANSANGVTNGGIGSKTEIHGDIILPNVKEPKDFARELKLATAGRG